MKTAMTINQLLKRRAAPTGVSELSSSELARVVGSGGETSWIAVEHLDQQRIQYGNEVQVAGRDLIKGLGNLELGSAAEAFIRMQEAADKEAAVVAAMNRELESHNESVQEQRRAEAAVDASIEAGINASYEPNMTMNDGSQGHDGYPVVQVGNEGGSYY